MLTADEIRCGNWIANQAGSTIQVHEQNIDDIKSNIHKYQPLGFSGNDFLRMAGFTQRFGTWTCKVEFNHRQYSFVWKTQSKSHNGWYIQDLKVDPQPETVHGFQNAFFNMFGEEILDYAKRTVHSKVRAYTRFRKDIDG